MKAPIPFPAPAPDPWVRLGDAAAALIEKAKAAREERAEQETPKT